LLKAITCPLCQEDYDKVIGVSKLQGREQKVALDHAVKEATDKERHRFDVLVDKQKGQVTKLKETIEHLRNGTTPQSVGYADETLLTTALAECFPDDDVQHKGKKGDVLHIVMVNGIRVGCLVYECKRTQSLTKTHVHQAYEAKGLRHADEAILVTTGKRKGFNGFAEMDGVYVVTPTGVLALVTLIRRTLIELKQANRTDDEKAKVLGNLRTYITEGGFKQAMSEVMQRSMILEDQLRVEIETHVHGWRERMDHYNHIGYNALLVQDNVSCLLLGGVPKEVLCPPAPVLPLLSEDNAKSHS